MADEMLLGEVTCPSGELILMDGGQLGLWSGERTPLQLDTQWVDAEITGPDAAAAAQAFHRQEGVSLYDIPRHARDRYVELFATLAADYDAKLRPLPEQVPHRERARRAIAGGYGQFSITGLPVVAIGDVPTAGPLPVHGVPGAGDGWSALRLTIRADAPASLRELGAIGVDSARLVFADADALSSWSPRHYGRAMAEVRASPFGAAAVELGDARVVFTMTGVEDGFFPVHLHLDMAGRPCAVTVAVESYD